MTLCFPERAGVDFRLSPQAAPARLKVVPGSVFLRAAAFRRANRVERDGAETSENPGQPRRAGRGIHQLTWLMLMAVGVLRLRQFHRILQDPLVNRGNSDLLEG